MEEHKHRGFFEFIKDTIETIEEHHEHQHNVHKLHLSL